MSRTRLALLMRESTLFTLSVTEGPALSPVEGPALSAAEGSAIEGRGECAPGGVAGPMKSGQPFRLKRLWSPVAGRRPPHSLSPMLAPATCSQPPALNLDPLELSAPANPLECVVTKNAPVSALESVVTKTKDLNCPGINTYKKHRGGDPPPCLLLPGVRGGVSFRHILWSKALQPLWAMLSSRAVTADPSARRMGHCRATHQSFCRYIPPLEELERVPALFRCRGRRMPGLRCKRGSPCSSCAKSN